MSESTPDQIRARLAELLGWQVPDVAGGCYFVRRPDRREVRWSALPDPASDLNAMADVEAELGRRGLGLRFLRLLVGDIQSAGRGDLVTVSAERLAFAVTAPAAVRALAAYRVLENKP